jgi:Holliday junction resolvase RusA-like endonuclease
MTLEITLPCVPPRSTAQSRTRAAMTSRGPRFYKKTPADWGRFRAQVEHKLRVAALSPAAWEVRRAKAVSLSLLVAYPWPLTTPKAKALTEAYRTTKPDADNLAKAIIDLLADCLVIPPDQCVANLTVVKINSPNPRLEIRAAAASLIRSE